VLFGIEARETCIVFLVSRNYGISGYLPPGSQLAGHPEQMTADWAPRADDRICSDHFSPNDIKIRTGRLNENTVPLIQSIFELLENF
jgi:hypothetical protein